MSNEDREIQEIIESWDAEPSQEMKQQAISDTLKDLEIQKQGTILYDPALKKLITYKTFAMNYGERLAEAALKAKENNEKLSKENYSEILKIFHASGKPGNSGRISNDKLGENNFSKGRREERKGSRRFYPLEYGFMDKMKSGICHKNPTALLMILLKHRSWKGKKDKHRTYDHWYNEKGLIVTSRSEESLAAELGTSERTIRRYISQLEKNGDIEIIKGEGSGCKRENIYVLGKVDKDGVERLYYSSPK